MNIHPYFSENDLQEFRSSFDALSRDSGNKYSSLLVLLFSVVLFYVFGTFSANPIDIVILIGVLFFHELGHLAGMKLFGYGDLRVFFIPFVGAAAMGKHDSASQVKKAIVSLMGPMPGILLSIVLFEFVTDRNPHIIQAINTLLFLNLYNLLPLMPLDGGRLVHELFTGNIIWSTIFTVVSGVLLALLAIETQTWFLLVVVFFVAVGQYSVFQYEKISKIEELSKGSIRSLDSILALPNEALNLILSSFRLGFRRMFEPKIRYKQIYKHLENLANHNNVTPSSLSPRVLLFVLYFVLLLTTLIYAGRITPLVQTSPQNTKVNNAAGEGIPKTLQQAEKMRPENYKETITFLDKAISRNPTDQKLIFDRARTKLQAKDYRGAIADASKLIELNPGPMAGYAIRASGRIHARDFKGAKEDYNWILMHLPDDAMMYSNRCFVKFLMNEFKSALEDCNKAMTLKPDNFLARNNTAHVKVALKDYAGALNDVDIVLKENSDNAEALYIRAKAKAGLKFSKEAYCADFLYARAIGLPELLPALLECK